MMRALFFDLLLFLLPFALYALYLRLAKQEEAAPARPYPWTMLFATGLSLVVASFLIWGITEGSGTKGVYVAPYVKDGRVVPGRVEPGGAP
jgi:Family of unknown function (DUF6111)